MYEEFKDWKKIHSQEQILNDFKTIEDLKKVQMIIGTNFELLSKIIRSKLYDENGNPNYSLIREVEHKKNELLEGNLHFITFMELYIPEEVKKEIENNIIRGERKSPTLIYMVNRQREILIELYKAENESFRKIVQ